MTIIEYLEREIARAEADAKSAQSRGDATMDACWQGAAYALKGVLEFLSEDWSSAGTAKKNSTFFAKTLDFSLVMCYNKDTERGDSLSRERGELSLFPQVGRLLVAIWAP